MLASPSCSGRVPPRRLLAGPACPEQARGFQLACTRLLDTHRLLRLGTACSLSAPACAGGMTVTWNHRRWHRGTDGHPTRPGPGHNAGGTHTRPTPAELERGPGELSSRGSVSTGLTHLPGGLSHLPGWCPAKLQDPEQEGLGARTLTFILFCVLPVLTLPTWPLSLSPCFRAPLGCGLVWHRGTQRRSESGRGPSGSLPRLGAPKGLVPGRAHCPPQVHDPPFPVFHPCPPARSPTGTWGLLPLSRGPQAPPALCPGPPGSWGSSGGTDSAPVRRPVQAPGPRQGAETAGCGPSFQTRRLRAEQEWPGEPGGRRRAGEGRSDRPRQGPVLRESPSSGERGGRGRGRHRPRAQRRSRPRSSAPTGPAQREDVHSVQQQTWIQVSTPPAPPLPPPPVGPPAAQALCPWPPASSASQGWFMRRTRTHGRSRWLCLGFQFPSPWALPGVTAPPDPVASGIPVGDGETQARRACPEQQSRVTHKSVWEGRADTCGLRSA